MILNGLKYVLGHNGQQIIDSVLRLGMLDYKSQGGIEHFKSPAFLLFF